MKKLAISICLLLSIANARIQRDPNRFLQEPATPPATPPPASPPPTPPPSTPPPAAEQLPTIDPTTGGFDTKQHSPKLPCFSCIMNDFIYCQNAPDHPHVELGQIVPQGVCCESKTNCPQMNLPGWTCSNSYSDKLLSLRMCPFDHSKCGNQSEIVFSIPGESMNQNLTFYPGDVCFFTMRAECGVPSFNPQGLETASGVDIFTIEYDDSDVDAEVVNVNETTTQIPDPLSNTTMKPKIPLPKKKENFDGSPKNISTTDAYLLRYQVNPDGTTTYFYSNGSAFSYETTTTITYLDPTDTKSYEVQYLNGTNITVNKDGSKVINAPGQAPETIPAPTTPQPSPPQDSYNYESSIDGFRLLQTTAPNTTTNTGSLPWGTVVFYYDGRVRELRADGTEKWDYQFYTPPPPPPPQNLTTNNTTSAPSTSTTTSNTSTTTSNQTSNTTRAAPVYNNTAFLKIRVFLNGSYIEYWNDGTINSFLQNTDWNKYYFIKKPNYARQIVDSRENIDGSVQLFYLNDTSRIIYPPLTIRNTSFQNATAPIYDDIILELPNQIVNRYYFNGTIALFTNKTFDRYIRAPISLAQDWKRVNFTDGSYVIYFETQMRKVFYPAPLKAGVASTYDIATSVLSLEDNSNGITRVVFRNGTIINKNNTAGTFDYEVQPVSLFPTTETKYMPDSICQYQVFDYVNDTNTMFYCPPDTFFNAKMNATGPKTNTTLRDGTRRIQYLNGTIARFSNNNTFIGYDVPPKGFFYDIFIVSNMDGSRFIDFGPINKTRREFPPPLPASASPMMIACAELYRDVFLEYSRVFYTNNSVAIFVKGQFNKFEVAPEWFFGGCRPGVYRDGRPMQNCTDFNQSVIVFHPPLSFKNTPAENATAPMRDIIFANFTFLRYFYNGSIAAFQDLQTNGQIQFLNWTVPPLSLFQAPVDYQIFITSDGSKSVQYSNQTVVTFSPDVTKDTPAIELSTGWVFRVKDPVAMQTRVHYRNGSVGIEWFNGTNQWQVPPKSFFVPFTETIVDGQKWTQWADGTYINNIAFPPETASEFEKATAVKRINGFANETEIISYYNGSVQENRNGNFFKFIVPPKDFYIEMKTQLNPDGSFEKFFSNGTNIWYAPPASKNETAEQFAFRVVMVEAFNNSKTLTFANGTVIMYQQNGTMVVKVPPKSLIVTRQAVPQPDGGLIEYFSNGTTRIISGPVDERLDEVERSRFVVMVEHNGANKSTRYYLNGTIAHFNLAQLVGYQVKPTRFYYGCVENQTADGFINQKCWNNTLRKFYPPLPDTATEKQRAYSIKFEQYNDKENTTQVFYNNGTIAVFDKKNGSFLSFLKQPDSFYMPYTSVRKTNGDNVIDYDNGTQFVIFGPAPATATLFENATRPAWNRTFSNGTFETKFKNGTHIRVEKNGTEININYIQKVEGDEIVKDGDKIVVKFQDNSTRTYFPPPPPEASDFDEMTAPNYSDVFSNGTTFIKYYNGSLADIFNGTFVRWIIKPEFFLEDIKRTDYPDGSFQIQFLKNKTVRFYVAPVSDTASKKEKALALLYIEKFLNGTVKRAFLNGTIAVYYNNAFLRYEVKPKEFYSEGNIDKPLEEVASDGSRKVFFSNGTVRYFESPDLKTDKLYMDCQTNLTCVEFYKNGTKIIYDDGVFVSREDPPVEERRDPTYKYVDKTGPKMQAYDKSQGGIKKYKEEYQNSDSRAQKSEPAEPLCKGRNQMIIMGDHRIKQSVYSSNRILQDSANEGPAVLALQMETVTFNFDTIPESFASKKVVSAIATVFALFMLFV